MLQSKLDATNDKLSNDEFNGLTIEDAWIEEAGEEFKAALRKQLTPQDRDFRLRMSNIGKPLCQLQHGAMGSEQKRKSKNFKVQMMIGDAVECITNLILKVSEVNITGGKNLVEMEFGSVTIKGEDDIEIDHKIYDVKSCSPFAFDKKWSHGYEALKEDDPFGYIGQLTGYAQAQDKELGGWIVVNKSTGAMLAVDANVSASEKSYNMFAMKNTVEKITSGAPLERQFDPVPDKFNRKPTGLKRLPMACGFCDFTQACYPKAEYKPHPMSKAKEPPSYWFVED